jgi:hypothetical protein
VKRFLRAAGFTGVHHNGACASLASARIAQQFFLRTMSKIKQHDRTAPSPSSLVHAADCAIRIAENLFLAAASRRR